MVDRSMLSRQSQPNIPSCGDISRLLSGPRDSFCEVHFMDEIWKSIPGFEGYYDVSNLGRVRSCTRLVRHAYGGSAVKNSRLITKSKTWSGYETINLSREGRATRMSVHRVVCEVFHGTPPSPKHHACHCNGIRDDNRAANLRWATPRENESDKIRHGTLPMGKRNGKYTKPEATPVGESHGNAKLTESQVRGIRRASGDYKISAYLLAQVVGVSKTSIKNIVNRKTWRHVT